MVGVVGSILAGVGLPLGLLLEIVGLVCGLVCGLVESMELNFFMIFLRRSIQRSGNLEMASTC